MNIFKLAKKYVERDVLINLLTHAEDNKISSQKKFANDIGIAVGIANVYIKRCISKGWIKINSVPNRRYVYYLTAKGFKEKSRLVTQYFKDSFNFFKKAKLEFNNLFLLCERKKIKRVAIAGDRELIELSIIVAKGNNFNIDYIFLKNFKKKSILDIPVTNSYKKLAKMDAILIADYNKPQEILDKLKVKLPKMRFMFPPMLSLKIEKN